VREFGSTSLGLAGSLLIAHPNLLDPNFRRTVLYIAANDAKDGSIGLILNRATGKTVSEFLSEGEVGLLSRIPVFVGGPVGRNQLTFAAFRQNDDSVTCQTHLDISDARELAEVEPGSVRAFIGYAGWSQGQLESELAQKAWLVQRPDEDVLDMEKCQKLWQTIMREQGPWFRLLAAAPDDPSKN
jgi:putative transcriptional regulator